MAVATSAVSITIGANAAVKGIGSVNVTVSQEPIDITGLGIGFTMHVAGLLKTEVELEFFWDSSNAGHTAILSAIEAGSAISPLTISWQSTKSISGKAMVTSWRLSSAPNGVNQVTATLMITAADGDTTDPLTITQ